VKDLPTRDQVAWPIYAPVTPTDLADPAGFLDRITDIPAGIPATRLPVERAGIADQHVQVTIPSFADPEQAVMLTGMVAAHVRLTVDQRGGHMSRLVQVIAESTVKPWVSMADYIAALARAAMDVQQATCGYASLEATAVVPRTTPALKAVSQDPFGVHASALATEDTTRVEVGLTGTIMTACPCTQAYSTYATVLELAGAYGLELANELGSRQLSFTHTQRATVQVMVDVTPGGLELGDCYRAVCGAAHVVHELLKRPDEHELVRRAHARPQFTEDVARDVAGALLCLARQRGVAPEVGLRVSCTALESIHAHTVTSGVEGTVGQLGAWLS
jgi:GTP cyclohydrolase-4